MSRRRIFFAFALAALVSGGWDSRLSGRELADAGFGQADIDALFDTATQVFEAALQQSRDTARQGGTKPVPPSIRAALKGFYDDDTLNRASFAVGDSATVDVATLALSYGDAVAVTLIDTVVFKSADDASNNTVLWAHELTHIQQFRDWGLHGFATRYLRNWNDVENEAYAKADEFARWRERRTHAQPPP